jgi:7-cyano-7-deazaguanine synthase in queuosine biosynthesis
VKPKILIMFSGGLDSTGAFWKLINSKEPLHVHHLHLKNKENRTEAENKAVLDIVEYMKKVRDFTYSDSFHEYPCHNGNFMWDSDLYNFIAGTICLSVKSIELVAIGRTKSDGGLDRADRGTKILKTLSPWDEKIYPVGDMTKKEIYEMLPEELTKMTWSCRTPIYGNEIKTCCKCKTCMKIKKIKGDL